MSSKTVDPEMLKELELLMDWDSLQEEANWESLSKEDALEDSSEEQGEKK